jgi:CHAT domain-containing protein/tetratricopeptide (TPR) repeat protein
MSGKGCCRGSRWGCGRKASFLAVLLGLSLTGGCQTGRGLGRPANGSISFVVGQNTLGESCRADLKVDTPEEGSVYRLFCGEWEEPSARIFVVGSGRAAELSKGGPWRDRLNSLANCGTPTPTKVLDGAAGLSMDCTLRAGGWPYQALAVDLGGRTFLVDSIPTAYPAAERAVGVIAGRAKPADAGQGGTVSDEMKRLEARLGAARYSAGDLARYRDLLRLAQYYNFQGNFVEAEQRYRDALGLQERLFPNQADGLCNLTMSIGLEQSNQGRFRVADATFRKAESYLPKAVEPTLESRLVSYRALHLANQRRDAEALALAQKATAMRRELARRHGYIFGAAALAPTEAEIAAGVRPRHGGSDSLLGGYAATALGDLVQSEYAEAAMLVEMNRLNEAEGILADALQITAREPRVPRRWIPQIKLLQAYIAERQGNYSRAGSLAASALATERKLFSRSRTEGRAQVALGRAYAGQGRTEDALAAFRAGIELIGEHGGRLRPSEVLPFFRVGALQAERNPSERAAIFGEMFAVAQMVRGPVVAQTMATTAARLASGQQQVGGLIRNLEDARYKRDRALAELTLVQSDPRYLAPQMTEVEKRWKALDAKVADLERQVQAAAPRYNQLRDAPVAAADATGVLRLGEAIAQIVVGSDGSFGFFADANGIVGYPIDLTDAQAREAVSRLRYPFEATDKLPEYPVGDAFALYQTLFAPVQERLATVKHLVVVPSGPFLSLPFGVLVVERPPAVANSDYSQVPFMAQRQGLTLAPSVQSFVNLRKTVQPARAAQRFVGYGDFNPSGDTEGLLTSLELPATCRDEVDSIAHAPRLPQTAQELQFTASALGASQGSVVLGARFSEATLRSSNLSNYRIISFATHGLLPSKLQCLSEPALLVSKSPGGGAANDGLLTSSEVVDLKLDSDLVVLSACDTGGPGGQTGGEALSGLARAFFYAGARSLVVSHWEVPSAPTTKLLSDTFQRASGSNVTLAEALRESQAAMIAFAPWSHPKAWGGFSVVGDGGQELSSGALASSVSTAQIATRVREAN